MIKHIFLFALLLGVYNAELDQNWSEMPSSSTDKPVYGLVTPDVVTLSEETSFKPNISATDARNLARLAQGILNAEKALERDRNGFKPLAPRTKNALERQLQKLYKATNAILEAEGISSASIPSNQSASRIEKLMQYMSDCRANGTAKLGYCKEKLQPGIDLSNEYAAEFLSWLANTASGGMSIAREKAGEGLSFAGNKLGEGLGLARNKAAEGLSLAGQAVSGLASDALDALRSFIYNQILDPRDASEVSNRIGENFGELKDVLSTTLQNIIELWAESCPAVKHDVWTILNTIYQRNCVNSDIPIDANNPHNAWPISRSFGSIAGITAYNVCGTGAYIACGLGRALVSPVPKLSYNVPSFCYKKVARVLGY